VDELVPIVYTPTVGLACQAFGHIYQRPRGLFVSLEDRGRVASVLRNWPRREVDILVVTDGERILGLGDLGASGMGIPIGKLALYSVCAGVHPARCLPVTLDVGTNNEEMLADPLYLGLRRRRVEGADYDALVEEFITAAAETFPGVLIQFEDFASKNAFRLLDTYRDRVAAFNDDIQGTAAVTLAGLMSALRIAGGHLREQKILFFGAGEAAVGIARLLSAAMQAEGLSAAEARARLWLFDSRGLVVASRPDLAPHKRPYAHEHAPIGDFTEALRALAPTALIGVSAVAGAFGEPVLRAMAKHCEHPIVFALSNPTTKAECTAEQAYLWSDGRALFACGSPFSAVTLGSRTFVPRQCNNSYVFPGVGLGAIASGARRVTDEMFLAAAHALAAEVSQEDLAQGSLYPPLARVREVSLRIAVAVAEIAYARGLATKPRPADLRASIEAGMYAPVYRSYIPESGDSAAP
jgi:malate dehydrogenase (oxaloacetate-decarboxylating)(NADP+)